MNDKITAIICEYNPFHHGHHYQIKKARSFSEIIICIMSGNTVQRGGFACCDKYERAKIAIEFGADIVVEHPFPHCMTSAADFSASGVYIADCLKANTLAFGHESNSEALLEISNILSDPRTYNDIKNIIKCSKEGKKLSFPKARELYLTNILGKEKAELLRLPNNILSVEYLINLKKYEGLSPVFIERNFDFISASEIRKKIYSDKNFSEDIPKSPSRFIDEKILDKSIISHLLSKKDYEEIYDCDFSLYCRILENAKQTTDLESLISKCTTSAYTASKIRRAIYSIVFQTKKIHVKEMPSFTVLLGASEKGLKYLSENKKRITLPILTRMCEEKKLKIDTELSLLPDRFFSLFLNTEYTPYKMPYIKK